MEEWDKMETKTKIKSVYKIYIGIVLALMMAIGGYAAWQLYASDDFEVTIDSTASAPISFSVVFDDVYMDTTTSNGSETLTAEISNINGEVDLHLAILTEIVDVEDDCTPETQEDCHVLWKFDEVGVYNGGKDVTIAADSTTNLTAEISCYLRSCPALMTGTATFSEII